MNASDREASLESRAYRGLRLDRRARTIPRRLIPVGLAGLGFTLLWWLVPPGALYAVMLPYLAILTWVASYGWRPALRVLLDCLHDLEQA